MRTTALVPSLVAGIALAGCAQLTDAYVKGMTDVAYGAVDDNIAAQVGAARTDALAKPGDLSAAVAFGTLLDSAYPAGTVSRGKLAPTMIDDATKALDAVTAERENALAVKGSLLLSAGQDAAGVAALEQSIDVKPNLVATQRLLPALVAGGKADQAASTCKKVRPTCATDADRMILLDQCSKSVGLAWASPDDQTFYARESAAAQAALDKRHAEEQAALDRSFSKPSSSSSSSGGGASAPTSSSGGPAIVSVTIRCTCNKTVPIFFGDKPKFGSGTKSTCSSNSVSSKQMEAGDMIWLIDESENGLGSATISAGTRNVEVSCTSVSAH